MDCGKVKYANKADANTVIKTLKRKSRRSKIPSRAYFCTDCGGWHLTSKPKVRHVKLKRKKNGESFL